MGGRSVSKEQYQQACAVDLYHFLLHNHKEAVKQEYGSVLLLADKHVSVKEGYHGYRNFKTNETGNNVDYLMHYLGYTYPMAVLALIGENEASSSYVPVINPPIPCRAAKEIALPEPSKGPYRNLYAYLISRGIPEDVIRKLIDVGIMYQSDKGNNIVFCSPAGDYCELRGTNTYADRRCKNRTECGQFSQGGHGWCCRMDDCQRYKPDPYHGCRKTRPDRFWFFAPNEGKPAEVVYICEAAIDAISLYVIHQKKKRKEAAVYVSIGGVANQKTIDRIKKTKNVVLAVDNDQAGEDCRGRNPDLEYIIPHGKDWNEDLKKGEY